MNRLAPRRIIVMAILAATVASPLCLAEPRESVKVPMRDGVKLATDVYVPAGDGPWPTILVMTPYGRKQVESIAAEGNRRGYAFVAQDFRGRFDSQGEDSPVFLHNGWGEHQDGYDTIEWIAQQKWSNGKIGGWGVSAPACALNMTAPSRPPHLTCNYSVVAFSSMYHQAGYQGGAFQKSLIEDWLKTSQFTPKNLEIIRAHPNYDDLWRQFDTESVASKVNVPTMYVGGWYDIFAAGTLNSFMRVNKQGDQGARGKCRLVMEAFGHGQSDDLVFPNAAQPAAADAWKWFEIWLKNDGKGIEEVPVVQYYVMGDPADPNTPGNKWRTAEDWPVPAEQVKIYFCPDKKLRLAPPQEMFGSLAYTYDPKKPVPTIGGANLTISKGPKDQRPVEEREDVLLFSSPTFRQYVEITGPIKVKLWASSTAPDTDFTAKVSDVYPDGRSMIVVDGIIRASHRNSMEKAELMEPGKIYEFEIDLWSTSWVISPGHHVHIALSSSNAPRFEPNPNTGKPSGSDDKTEVATNTIYMNAEYPSHIVVPVAAH